jgi:hypothetical protein
MQESRSNQLAHTLPIIRANFSTTTDEEIMCGIALDSCVQNAPRLLLYNQSTFSEGRAILLHATKEHADTKVVQKQYLL